MNGWIKYFADNTVYIGDDIAVDKGRASWQQSRLTDIVAVSVEHNGCILKITGVGPFWQSDRYESVYPGGAQILKRRIEKQIESSDKYFRVAKSPQAAEVVFNGMLDGGKFISIPASWHGRWLILEWNIAKNQSCYYIKDRRV